MVLKESFTMICRHLASVCDTIIKLKSNALLTRQGYLTVRIPH